MLQNTASGFQKSANRRVDVELCLLRMCDPALDLDAQAINARLSRVETMLASGVLPAARPPAQTLPDDEPTESASVPEETATEAAASEQASPPQEQTLPIGFWADLVSAVRKWKPSLGGYFNTTDAKLIVPSLSGDMLELSALGETVLKIVDHDDVRAQVAEQASMLLHRPIRVRFTLRGADAEKHEKMKELMEKQRQYPEIFHVSE